MTTSGTDPEATIVGAFQMFDKKDCGKISEDELLKILQNKRGEPFDDDEIKAMYKVSYVFHPHVLVKDIW